MRAGQGEGTRGQGLGQLEARGQVKAGQGPWGGEWGLEVKGQVRVGRGHGMGQFRGQLLGLCLPGTEG